jgi:hypothetical protein
MADGSQIHLVIASAPGRDEGDDRCCDGQTYDDPHRIHKPSRSFASLVSPGSALNGDDL